MFFTGIGFFSCEVVVSFRLHLSYPQKVYGAGFYLLLFFSCRCIFLLLCSPCFRREGIQVHTIVFLLYCVEWNQFEILWLPYLAGMEYQRSIGFYPVCGVV